MSEFEVLHTDNNSAARCGVLATAHGRIETPAFMPVGTCGAVKGITPQQLGEIGADVILANTYHLMLRPGVEAVEKLGGLHKFMAWNGPILTDSGGYQIFSLAALTKIDNDGVEFASHIDGQRVYLDAEGATKIQNRLGADIIMCFDQCTGPEVSQRGSSFSCDPAELEKAVERTIRWASECKKVHSNAGQLLFGIVQGGTDLPLRAKCARAIVKLDFDGYAIGGLSVGEGHEDMIKTTGHTVELLPAEKPRYLMGVGTPADIIAAVRAGMDMFDCVLPTRNGRNAYAFTEHGPLRLRNSAHISDAEPIEAGCDCYCCLNFTRSTIRHFFNVGEMLGPILVSIHNLRFYQRLMAKIRHTMGKGRFSEWSEENLRKYKKFDLLRNGEINSANSL
jgi:queuine tRNA-ribosyltransferase